MAPEGPQKTAFRKDNAAEENHTRSTLVLSEGNLTGYRSAVARIFVSYRRKDSPYVSAVIYDRLQQRFGAESVFFDIDTVPLGVDFRKHVGRAVGECDALLAVIGDRWNVPTDAHPEGRLNDPDDYVRAEIESALSRRIPVVPVLVDNAVVPEPSRLPDSLSQLSFNNAAEVRAGKDLQQHLERLIKGLEDVLRPRHESHGKSPGDITFPVRSIKTLIYLSLVFAWIGSFSVSITVFYDFGGAQLLRGVHGLAYKTTYLCLVIGGLATLALGGLSFSRGFLEGVLQGWLWPIVAAFGQIMLLVAMNKLFASLPAVNDLEAAIGFILGGAIAPSILTVTAFLTLRALGAHRFG